MRQSITRIGPLLVVVAAAVSCGSDNGGESIEVDVGITSEAEWCDVLVQTDNIVASLGNHDFAAVQADAERGRRLVAQLMAATDEVDAQVRPAVEQLTSFMSDVFAVYATSDSAADAQSEAWGDRGVAARYSEDELAAIEESGRPWIVETCQVDVFD